MRGSKRAIRVGAVVLVALMSAGLTACGDDDDDEAATTTAPPPPGPQGAPAIDVNMTEYAFNVSGPLTAGGTMRLRNSGDEFHVMALGKMKPGVTLDQVRSGLAEAGPPGGEGGEEEGGGGAPTTTRAGGSGTTSTTSRGGTTTTASRSGTTASRGGTVAFRGGTTTTSRGGTTSTLAGGGEGEEGEGGEGEDPLAQFFEEPEIGAPGTIMGPGQAAEITAPELRDGRYAMICFIPVEGGGPPHFVQGMINELNVVPGTVPPPTAAATYQVAPDDLIEGPETLRPGKQVVKIEAAAGSERLEPTFVKPDAGRTIADMERVFETFEEEVPEDAADQVPGDLVAQVLNFGELRTLYLGVDLTPGTYQLGVTEATDDAPARRTEAVTIRVE